ncbi:MAG: hypothetical protein GXO42_01855 [bacterium]|nr:hypothetical protein [bacterium]
MRRLLAVCAVLACLAALFYYAYFYEPYAVQVTKLSIKVPGLHRELLVLAVSDLHLSSHDWKNAEYLVSLACKLHPAMIWIAGDAVDSKQGLRLLARLLAQLKPCTHYIIAVPGNWEYTCGCSKQVAEIYKKYGALYLVNKKIKLYNITIAGIDTLHPNFSVAQGAEIVLVHYPLYAKEIAEKYHPILVFCGHTHGGQVVLPGIGPLYLPKYSGGLVAGKYYINGTLVYVTRGLGLFKYFPFRFFCPPEIVELRLV